MLKSFTVPERVYMRGVNQVDSCRKVEPRPDPVNGEEGYVETSLYGTDWLRISMCELIQYAAKKGGIGHLPARG